MKLLIVEWIPGNEPGVSLLHQYIFKPFDHQQLKFMKKLMSSFLMIFFTGLAMAQTGKMKDCIMMKNDSMMVMKAGKSMMLHHDTTVSHGTMVMKNGMVKMKDGSTHMMKNGEYIIDGKIKMSSMNGMMEEK